MSWVGRLPDSAPEKQPQAQPCGDCYWRMVHDPPKQPWQRCANGHLLPWAKRGDETYRAGDDDGEE